jgi:hypothetical protein
MRKMSSISTVQGADAADGGETLDDFGVRHFADGCVGGHGAIESAGGQVAQGFDLIAGDAGGAERLVGRVEESCGAGSPPKYSRTRRWMVAAALPCNCW